MENVVEPVKSGLYEVIGVLLDDGSNTIEERVAEATLRLAHLTAFKDSVPNELWVELLSIVAELAKQTNRSSPSLLTRQLAERLLVLYVKIDGGIVIY